MDGMAQLATGGAEELSTAHLLVQAGEAFKLSAMVLMEEKKKVAPANAKPEESEPEAEVRKPNRGAQESKARSSNGHYGRSRNCSRHRRRHRSRSGHRAADQLRSHSRSLHQTAGATEHAAKGCSQRREPGRSSSSCAGKGGDRANAGQEGRREPRPPRPLVTPPRGHRPGYRHTSKRPPTKARSEAADRSSPEHIIVAAGSPVEGEVKKTDQNEDDGDGWWRLYRSAMPWEDYPNLSRSQKANRRRRFQKALLARESDERRCE